MTDQTQYDLDRNARHTANLAKSRAFAAAFRWTGAQLLRLLRLDPISRAEKQLQALPDSILSDIGISRSDIPKMVRHGRENTAMDSVRTTARRRAANDDHSRFKAA